MGEDRQVGVQMPTVWIVQELFGEHRVTAICVDHGTAAWWRATYGEGRQYEITGLPLTVRGMPSSITVRRMEVTRDGTPRVL
jgi:hypothetical protein